MGKCRVCEAATEELFRSPSDIALLSSATPIPGKTFVEMCRSCGHAQTEPIPNISDYYASSYQFRVRAEDEDDLYDRVGDKNIFRSQRQADISAEAIDFSASRRVLDYGCGKGRSLKLLVEKFPAIDPYVFDVSEAYQKYWDAFVPRDQQSCFSIPADWYGKMDVVLAYFSLEHVEDPQGFVAELKRIIKVGGHVLVFVPNVLRNFSDLLVADHVNHFSEVSLTRLFSRYGFTTDIDIESFRGAFVVKAVRLEDSKESDANSPVHLDELANVAHFWSDAATRIRASEGAAGVGGKVAIYGSGIYGLFVFSMLQHRERVCCFLDQNPWRQDLSFMSVPVRPPGDCPADVDTIYVGLNPSLARAAIGGVSALAGTRADFFYL